MSTKKNSDGNGSNGHPLFHAWEPHEDVAAELPKEIEEYHLDCQGKKRLFRLNAYDNSVPHVEAVEIREGQPTGWHFTSPWDPDELPPYHELREKIAARLATRDMVREPGTNELAVLNMLIRAQVAYTEDGEAPGPDVLVDGDRITWAELGEMLKSYEGWGLHIEITGRGGE